MAMVEGASQLSPVFEATGHLHRVGGSLHARIAACVGEQVLVRDAQGTLVPGEVIGFDEKMAQILPLKRHVGFAAGDLVIASGQCAQIPLGFGLLGRVLNSGGQPIDGKGAVAIQEYSNLTLEPVLSTDRKLISDVLPTGIRAIDSMLTVGRGQRVGIFAGSGVGKSTLLSDLVKNSCADVNVVALVGERGREVRPFLENALGAAGLARSVVVVSTSDESPLSRIRAADSAVATANWFRERGKDVLLVMDSLTRYATAQKELALMLGEPPASRGFPASVFQRMAILLEQLGNSNNGSITGFITVLVDGDDMNEPVADAARSILDGHIVLTRELAEQHQFPAIDVLASISRVFREICQSQHIADAAAIRRTIALYREVEDLIRIGAYQKGNMPQTDRAIESIETINTFLCQQGNASTWQSTISGLRQLAIQFGAES